MKCFRFRSEKAAGQKYSMKRKANTSVHYLLHRMRSQNGFKFTSYKLLILDEWLLDDLSEEEQHFLFELIERRHDTSATILCTQFKKEDWHIRLGGDIHADAMMDRIVHNAAWTFTGNLKT